MCETFKVIPLPTDTKMTGKRHTRDFYVLFSDLGINVPKEPHMYNVVRNLQPGNLTEKNRQHDVNTFLISVVENISFLFESLGDPPKIHPPGPPNSIIRSSGYARSSNWKQW